MTKRKFTEEEKVLRGLGACATGTWENCSTCPYQGLDRELDTCWEKLCADAVAVIERQARCVEILDGALDESAVLLGALSDEVARLTLEAKIKAVRHATKYEGFYFSAEEVRRMTLDEVGVCREVILKSMRYWHEGSSISPARRGARGFLGREDI